MCGLQHVLLSFIFIYSSTNRRTLVLTLTGYVGDTLTYNDFYQKRPKNWIMAIIQYIYLYLLLLIEVMFKIK